MTVRIYNIAVSMTALAACAGSDPDLVCNRECLIEIGDAYLEALAANDPNLVPLADNTRIVENLSPIATGDGLWTTAAGISSGFRIHVPDPEQAAIGLIALIERRAELGAISELLAVRLKIESGSIIEAEHLVGDIQSAANPADLDSPRDGIVAVVPENQRESRAALADIAERYYEGLVTSDASNVPFADDCERQENGLITAGWNLAPASFESVDVNGNSPPPVARDCIGQMNSARFAYIDSIDNRRVFAVDPVQGLVMGFSHFRQSMSRGPLEMIAADGTRLLWEEQREPYDLPAAHVFKITNGEIHEIEAIGIFVPYNSPTGWE